MTTRLGIAEDKEDAGKKFNCEETGRNRAEVEKGLGLRCFLFCVLDGKDLNTLRADEKEAGKREVEEVEATISAEREGEVLGDRTLGWERRDAPPRL